MTVEERGEEGDKYVCTHEQMRNMYGKSGDIYAHVWNAHKAEEEEIV